MNDEEMHRATAREWRAAQIVFGAGFAIAIAVAGYFTWQQHKEAAQEQAALEAQQQQATQQAPAPPAQSAADQNRKDAMLVCAMELVNAKNFGIVPGYGQLISKYPHETGTRGRYACLAATQVAKYTLEADLICRNLQDPRCVLLYSITRDDGNVLYKRQG